MEGEVLNCLCFNSAVGAHDSYFYVIDSECFDSGVLWVFGGFAWLNFIDVTDDLIPIAKFFISR